WQTVRNSPWAPNGARKLASRMPGRANAAFPEIVVVHDGWRARGWVNVPNESGPVAMSLFGSPPMIATTTRDGPPFRLVRNAAYDAGSFRKPSVLTLQFV